MYRSLFLALVMMGCSDPLTMSQALKKPASSDFVVYLDGKPLRFELTPSEGLFAEDFVHHSAGPLIRPSCYFSGSLIDSTSSHAVMGLKMCDQLEGFVLIDDRWFSIVDSEGVYHLKHARPQVGSCGVKGPLAPTESESEHAGYALLTEDPDIVEVLIVRDRSWFSREQQGGVMSDPVLAVQAAALVYDRANFVRRILPVVVGVVDAPDSNPWGDPTFRGGFANPNGYLDDFNAWLYASRNQLPRHDHASLLTGLEFTDSTIGLANLDSACDQEYQGALVWGEGVAASVGQTFAHELGHTLGMWHDGEVDNCAPNNFVMTAVYDTDGPFPTRFSTCSEAMGSTYLSTFAASCINPISGATEEPKCGDGVVEGTEQCDCGPLGCDGRDPCCTLACTLRQGATCSTTDGCCDPESCQPFGAAANHVCRPASSSCDQPETCDGNPFCPPNLVRSTGTTCADGDFTGACFMGQCVSRGGSCEQLEDLYVLDTPSFEDRCADTNDCGPIPCVSNNACVVLEEWAFDGTPCAAGRQCFAGICQPSQNLPGTDGCAAPGLDSDEDGTPDCEDACPYNTDLQDPGACGCEPCVDPTDPQDPNPEDPTPQDPEEPQNPNLPGDLPTPTPKTDSGCTTGLSAPVFWSAFGILALRRRRRK